MNERRSDTIPSQKGLTRNEFYLLQHCAMGGSAAPEAQIASGSSKMSLSVFKRTLHTLETKGFISGTRLTKAGRQALQPYRVKRAVFLAAGFGSRLVPITLNTPKPLIRVHGKRIIDTLLDAVLAAGINEIYIVRGYLKEQFDQLLYDYPMIRFLENPYYNESNNISSALCVSGKLANAYVFESDTLLQNPALITPYQYTTNYLGVPVARTDDWCLVTQNGVIKEPRMGGTDCYRWIGISYWNAADGRKLKKHIPATFQKPGGRERLWDMVPLEYYKSEYRIEIRECTAQDVTEIDSLRELQEIDPAYRV